MSALRILSISEQIAAHLRGEIARGRWSGMMPGRKELARQCEVGINSMEEALRELEKEGVIASQGAGRMRRITGSARGIDKRRLRIAVLAYERSGLSDPVFSEAVHVLREAGHDAFFTRSSLVDLGMNVSRVACLVGKTEADAWIVDELKMFVATQQFLALKELSVPGDVSLVSMESDPAFEWCRPTIACIHWDHLPVMRRVVGWTNNVARGKVDLRETHTLAEFIDGGSVGPARG